MAGRGKATEGEQIDLVYSRFNHPNAEILEDHLVPIEAGASAALIFNSGMSAIMTAMMTFVRPGDTIVYTVPIYGGTQHLVEDLLTLYGIVGVGVVAGDISQTRGASCASEELPTVLGGNTAEPQRVMA